MNQPDGTELEFPLLCHFKIIGEQSDALLGRLEQTLTELDIHEPLQAGRVSSGGRYTSYTLSMTVSSLEAMKAIDAAFRNVEGVKMVL